MSNESYFIRCFILKLVSVLSTFRGVMLDLGLGRLDTRLRYVAVIGESADLVASLAI